MKEEKQELKSKWLSCLADMFETAKNSKEEWVKVTYSELRNKVNSKYPDINVTGRAPSYCNALRSVLQDDDIKEGTEGSSTYRVTFMLPRDKPLSLDRQDKRTGQNNFSKCKKPKHDLSLFKDEMTRIEFLQKTENEYRPGDKGRILYKGVVQYSGDKYSREFIKKVYQILIAWNMNAKAAKLNDLHPFIKTIQDNAALFKTLENIKIDKLSDTVVMTTLGSLFCKLELVKTKSKLVTFAKTMHFFFPALIVPIDRKYTLGFFKIYHYNIDTLEKQWDVFERLERLFSDFSKTIDLNTYIDENGDWNLNVPKIIDNLIIGHHLSKGKLMNKNKVSMYVTLYENLLLLREPFVDLLSDVLPRLYPEDWWKKCVVESFEDERDRQRIDDENTGVFASLDMANLLNILKYNWQMLYECYHSPGNYLKMYYDTFTAENSDLRFRIKRIRNKISHANEDDAISRTFNQDLDDLIRFARFINADTGVIKTIESRRPARDQANACDDDKKLKLIEFLQDQVLNPALLNQELDDDIKDSISNTIDRINIKESAREVADFYKDALFAKRGKAIAVELNKHGLKSFEDIENEFFKIYNESINNVQK